MHPGETALAFYTAKNPTEKYVLENFLNKTYVIKMNLESITGLKQCLTLFILMRIRTLDKPGKSLIQIWIRI